MIRKGTRSKKFIMVAGLMAALAGILLISSACATVSAQDIKGILQDMDGKEVTIKLDDGSTIRISISPAQASSEAQSLVGQLVTAEVETDDDGNHHLVSLRQDEDGDNEGEDQDDSEFTGVVTAISANSITIGDRTFKLTSGTEKKGNIVVGATVEVKFVTLLADGSLVAEEIDVIKPAPQP